MLNGFRRYFLESVQVVGLEAGLSELSRLEKGHFLVVLPSDREKTAEYLKGKDGLRHIAPEMVVTAERIGHMGKTVGETLLVMSIPKKWFTKQKLEEKGVAGVIGEFLPLGPGWKLPANYVWGYFSKWDENQEEIIEPGQFYRNLSYHGHDGLYNVWKGENARSKKPQSLDRPTPRIVAPYSPTSGRFASSYSDAFVLH